MRWLISILIAISAVSSEGFCLDDWIAFRDSCYYFSSPIGTSWHGGESFCEGKGAQLIKINDADEDMFIRSVIGEDIYNVYWIGLKSVPHDNYYWLDNSVMNYTSMWPTAREAGLKEDEQQCVYYRLYPDPSYANKYDPTWTPGDCLNRKYYICQMGNSELIE